MRSPLRRAPPSHTNDGRPLGALFPFPPELGGRTRTPGLTRRRGQFTLTIARTVSFGVGFVAWSGMIVVGLLLFIAQIMRAPLTEPDDRAGALRATGTARGGKLGTGLAVDGRQMTLDPSALEIAAGSRPVVEEIRQCVGDLVVQLPARLVEDGAPCVGVCARQA